MRTGNNRNHILCDIYATLKTMFINIRKVIFKSFLIQMRAIEPYMIISPYFHLIINCSGNYITRSK